MILLPDFSVTSLLNSYLTRVHSLVCLVEGFMFIFFLLCRIIIQQIELVQLFFLQNLMWFNMSKIYKNKFDVWYVADTKTGSILSQIYINWTVMIHDINDICLTICDHTIYGVPPVFVRTRSHSFACLLLLNTEQNRQQFTIYYLPTQNQYTDKCQCLYDKSTNMLTTKSMGVGERPHCPCSAMEGLGVHRNTNTQKGA